MRYEFKDRVDCQNVGSRVTVRSTTPDGFTTDTVGLLEACSDDSLTIVTKRGDRVELDRRLIVASRVIPPPGPKSP